jgi:hypothetical protein
MAPNGGVNIIPQEIGRILELTKGNIIIDYIHFQYVDKTRPQADLPNGGVTDISDDVLTSYSEYINKVAQKRLAADCYDIYKVETDYSSKVGKEIDEMLRRPIPEEIQELEENARMMASRLLLHMRKTSNPKHGVLFQILYREAGVRKLCFLKLAWFDGRYFDYDEKKSSMKKMELLEKLPDRGAFQKGAIYPHPDKSKSDAYMKVYQNDTEANYFDDFLGGSPGVSGRDMMKELKRLAKSMTVQPLTFEQNIGLHRGISLHLKTDRKQVDDKDLTRIIQHALPSISRKVIKETVENNRRVKGIVDGTEIQDQKMSLMVGGIRLVGSYAEFEKRFEPNSKTNEHTIKGKMRKIELE